MRRNTRASLRGVTPKEHRQLVRRVKKLGAVVTHAGSSHLRITNPRTGEWMTMAGSARAPAVDQIKRDLRRIGYDL